MFCQSCGNSIEEGAVFCTKCGTRVDGGPVQYGNQAYQNQQPQYGPPQYGQPYQGKQSSMNPWQGFISAGQKYAVFKGRARRAEYWGYSLFSSLFLIVTSIMASGGELLYILWNILALAFLLPGIGVCIRRMHDVGKSGWYALIPVYGLVLACTEGNYGPNQYGPDPKSV